MIKKKSYKDLCCFLIMLVFSVFYSCNKIDYKGKDPYAGAKPALTVKLNENLISPEMGAPGAVVNLYGEDFAKYRDSGMTVKFNSLPGEIMQVSDSVLKVKVPKSASSGMITLTVSRQVFPGPIFRVKGKLNLDDSSFHSMPGANGTINCIKFVPGGKYLIGGSFSNYGNSGFVDGYHGIARLNMDGSIDKSFFIGKGVQGTVNTIAVQANGKYILGGNFSNFKERFKTGAVSNIMRLNNNGTMDTMVIKNESHHYDTLPSLNAYFDGSVNKILKVPYNEKLIVIGGYKYFMKKDFTIASEDGLRDSVEVDSIRMEGIVRLNEDGSFDSTFNYDNSKEMSFPGPNGSINDAIIQNDGKVVIVGNFTKYHDKPISRIARLNKDGSLDATFNPGEGPDSRVFSISFLEKEKKYLIAGQFNHFNGTEMHKVAIVNSDGSLDNSFNLGEGPTAGPDGIVLQAERLNNNKILVTGLFNYFSEIKRDGTVVLNADGSVSKEFNNLGAIEPLGSVSQILNVPLPNTNAVIIVGRATKFDFKSIGRIALLKY